MAREGINPLWVHIGLVVVVFIIQPIAGGFYLSIILVYYLQAWLFRVLRSGPNHPWYKVAQKVLVASILALMFAIGGGYLFAINTEIPKSPKLRTDKNAEMVFWAYCTFVASVPVTFVSLYILAIPIRIGKNFRNAAKKRRRDMEYEISKLESDRQDQLRQERESHTQADSAKRAEIRAKCELHYERYAPELVDRFPRTRFEAFVKAHLSDSHDVPYVLARGKELVGLIESHRRAIVPDVKPQTIADISKWYLGQKQEIESLPLDEDLKHEHIVALDRRYAEITQNFLEKMGPS